MLWLCQYWIFTHIFPKSATSCCMTSNSSLHMHFPQQIKGKNNINKIQSNDYTRTSQYSRSNAQTTQLTVDSIREQE